MRKVFDVAVQTESLEQTLNDPMNYVEEIVIGCRRKTGYTSALVRYKQSRMPIDKPRKRRIRRFVLVDGGNLELDMILSAPYEFRIIEEYEFETEDGVIIVLHYEERDSGPQLQEYVYNDGNDFI